MTDGTLNAPAVVKGSVSGTAAVKGDLPEEQSLSGGIGVVFGKDGVGIASVEQVTAPLEDGGENVIRVNLTNNEHYNFSVRNGSTGPQGPEGEPGKDANVTAENIQAALGFEPMSEEATTEQLNEVVDELSMEEFTNLELEALLK